jgi:hypothetical protein
MFNPDTENTDTENTDELMLTGKKAYETFNRACYGSTVILDWDQLHPKVVKGWLAVVQLLSKETSQNV